jgi:hypothetical protein
MAPITALTPSSFDTSLTYPLALKTEAIYSSEMSVKFYRAIRRYIPEDKYLQSPLLNLEIQ